MYNYVYRISFILIFISFIWMNLFFYDCNENLDRNYDIIFFFLSPNYLPFKNIYNLIFIGFKKKISTPNIIFWFKSSIRLYIKAVKYYFLKDVKKDPLYPVSILSTSIWNARKVVINKLIIKYYFRPLSYQSLLTKSCN